MFISLFLLLTKPALAITATDKTTNENTISEQSEAIVTTTEPSVKRDDASFVKENPNQQFIYAVNYKGISIGEMKQEYHWKGKNVAVNSEADFSFYCFHLAVVNNLIFIGMSFSKYF